MFTNTVNTHVEPSNRPRTFHGVPLVALPPDASRILCVGNLDGSVTGETLYRVFHKYGPLRQVRVSAAPDTVGTAFVVFRSVFDAQRAQEHLNGLAVAKGGAARPLTVRFYDERRHAAAAERKRRRKEHVEQLARRQKELLGDGSAPPSVVTPAPAAAAGERRPRDE